MASGVGVAAGGRGGSRVGGLGSSKEQVQKHRLWSGPLGKFLGLGGGAEARDSSTSLSCPPASKAVIFALLSPGEWGWGEAVASHRHTHTHAAALTRGSWDHGTDGRIRSLTDLISPSTSHRAGGTDTHSCTSALKGDRHTQHKDPPHSRSPAAPAHTPSPAPQYTQTACGAQLDTQGCSVCSATPTASEDTCIHRHVAKPAPPPPLEF